MNHKILIVDDDKISHQLIQWFFNKNYPDYEVLSSYSGLQTLQLLEFYKVDLIFMDIMMPEMDGFEVTDMIRNFVNLDTPIIAITAMELNKNSLDFYDKGFNEYIKKPIIINDLHTLVRKFIR